MDKMSKMESRVTKEQLVESCLELAEKALDIYEGKIERANKSYQPGDTRFLFYAQFNLNFVKEMGTTGAVQNLRRFNLEERFAPYREHVP